MRPAYWRARARPYAHLVTVLVGTDAGVFALRGDDAPVRETEGRVQALAPDPDGTCWGILERRTLIRRELDGAWTPSLPRSTARSTRSMPPGSACSSAPPTR